MTEYHYSIPRILRPPFSTATNPIWGYVGQGDRRVPISSNAGVISTDDPALLLGQISHAGIDYEVIAIIESQPGVPRGLPFAAWAVPRRGTQ